MNFSDMENLNGIYFIIIFSIVAGIVILSKLIAYYGGINHIHDKVVHYCVSGRHEQAIQMLEKRLAQNAISPLLNNEMGYALILANRPLEAKPYLEKAARLDPREITPLVNLSWACNKLLEHREAIEYSEKVLSMYPKDVHSWINRGTSNLGMERFADALDYFGRALKLDPGSVRSLLGYGVASFHLGNTDDAIEVLQKYLRIIPNDAAACEYLAKCWKAKGMAVQELQAYKMILLIDESYHGVFYSLAECHHSLGECAKSLEYLEKETATNPDSARAFYLKSRSLCRLRRNSEAMNAIREAIRLDSALKKEALDEEELDSIKVFREFQELVMSDAAAGAESGAEPGAESGAESGSESGAVP